MDFESHVITNKLNQYVALLDFMLYVLEIDSDEDITKLTDRQQNVFLYLVQVIEYLNSESSK